MVLVSAQAVHREDHTSPHVSFLIRCSLNLFGCKIVVHELPLRYLFEQRDYGRTRFCLGLGVLCPDAGSILVLHQFVAGANY